MILFLTVHVLLFLPYGVMELVLQRPRQVLFVLQMNIIKQRGGSGPRFLVVENGEFNVDFCPVWLIATALTFQMYIGRHSRAGIERSFKLCTMVGYPQGIYNVLPMFVESKGVDTLAIDVSVDPTNLTGSPGANFGFPVVDGEEAANNHAGNSGRSTAIEEQNAAECQPTTSVEEKDSSGGAPRHLVSRTPWGGLLPTTTPPQIQQQVAESFTIQE